ncbi:hypothetical protein HIM_04198 [Hirsutella minnesotensis 3608]|uniref:superoxide dismutase n=1 Tax=Hirsutella minnesotensis 3608 TaxID=1043627 RepID=A0A0F8A651_9HYPO|nr:hypothetical protein HIM_04198 [Hirsutella minnesotensis 3608]
MPFSTIRIAFLGAAAVAVAQVIQTAPIVSGNPLGVTYQATLPETPFFTGGSLNGNVKGSVSAQSSPDGVGVRFSVNFDNVPKQSSSDFFSYHIHTMPVPADGNCTSALAHLDPTNRGENPICDSSSPQSCQVGDLSGKYGFVTDTALQAEYVDPFSSLKEGDASFVGNRSIVFHFGNKTRITCANFVRLDGQTPVGLDSNSTGGPGYVPSEPGQVISAGSSVLSLQSGALPLTLASLAAFFIAAL